MRQLKTNYLILHNDKYDNSVRAYDFSSSTSAQSNSVSLSLFFSLGRSKNTYLLGVASVIIKKRLDIVLGLFFFVFEMFILDFFIFLLSFSLIIEGERSMRNKKRKSFLSEKEQ